MTSVQEPHTTERVYCCSEVVEILSCIWLQPVSFNRCPATERPRVAGSGNGSWVNNECLLATWKCMFTHFSYVYLDLFAITGAVFCLKCKYCICLSFWLIWHHLTSMMTLNDRDIWCDMPVFWIGSSPSFWQLDPLARLHVIWWLTVLNQHKCVGFPLCYVTIKKNICTLAKKMSTSFNLVGYWKSIIMSTICPICLVFRSSCSSTQSTHQSQESGTGV